MKKSHFFAAVAVAAVALPSCGGKYTHPTDTFISEVFDTDLVPVQVNSNGLFGYISPDGKLAIDAKFTQASYFHDGLAIVMDSMGNYSYIDRSGKQAIDTRYASATDFNNGLAWASEPDSALAVIDTKGHVKFRFPKATAAELFLDGYSRYKMPGNTMGLVSDTGTDVLLPDTCNSIDICGNGYYIIFTNKYEHKLCHLDGDRLEIVNPDMSFKISGFSPEYNLIKVYDGDNFGLADLNGKIVVNPRYSLLEFDRGGLILFKNDKDKFGWLNPKGEEVIPAKYAKISDLFGSNDYTAVSTTGNKFQTIDRKGNTLMPPKYDKVLITWTPGIVSIYKEDEGFGLATPEGEVLCEPQFELSGCVAKNVFMATSNENRWGVINTNGTYESKMDYMKPMVFDVLHLNADSHLFDPLQAESLIKDMMERANYNTSIAALASLYSLSKSEVEENGWDVVLKSKRHNNLNMNLDLIVTPDNPAIVSPSYWSTRTEFNKNAKPALYTVAVTFDDAGKCRKVFDHLKTQCGWTADSEPTANDTSFSVKVKRDGSINLECYAITEELE